LDVTGAIYTGRVAWLLFRISRTRGDISVVIADITIEGGWREEVEGGMEKGMGIIPDQ